MKHFIIFLSLLLQPGQDSIGVMFWNLENFFDCRDGGANDSDREFSARGERHWSRRRFDAKCASIAKTLFWEADRRGGMPEIFCFAEVENRLVIKRLIENTGLRKYDYSIVHFDSPDPRGIDCGLIYDKTRLTLKGSRPCGIPGLETRDILLAQFETLSGDSLAVMVLHLPSQYSGKASAGRRERAVARIMAVSDSLDALGWMSQLAIGDFNDVPEAPEFAPLARKFTNITSPLSDAGEGSIRFNGHWELIDQCLVTHGMAPRCRANVLRVPFLTVRDTAHGGEKPLRTYQGPRYLGGVSDHCPIIADIVLHH